MRAFKHDGTLFPILLATLLCASMVPDRLLADDKDTSNSPVKSAPAKSDAAKIEAPAPLTERERLLLDRVELLEKRGEELETKGGSPAVPVAAAASSQPGSLSPSTSTVTASAAGVTPAAAAAEANSNVIPVEKVLAAVNPQATEKGKPDTAKAPKAEPFAFADFTWLNGNARTKELAMDTKFFTPEIRTDVDYIYDFNHPKDNTIGGSSEGFKAHQSQVPPPSLALPFT